jgi:hypothetical protein
VVASPAGVVAVVLSVFVVVAVMKSVHSQRAQGATRELHSPPATTAVGRDTTPPWAAPSDAATAVRAAGLPMLRQEGNVVHIHAHLDVSVDGQPVVVPGGIGIGWSSQGISPLHTHNASGVIHIESPVNRAYTLGESSPNGMSVCHRATLAGCGLVTERRCASSSMARR